jgi:hypothetical protein
MTQFVEVDVRPVLRAGGEPIFLFPELAKRGHGWRGGFEPDGATYKVLVRIGGAVAA